MSLIVHKITTLLEILNLIKDTVHLYLLVQWLDMDLLHMCQEELSLIVSGRNVIKVTYNSYYFFIVPGAVSTINVNVLNISIIQITWSPVAQEETNGNITHYIVSVSLYEGRELYNRDISVSSDLISVYPVIVNGLCECFSIQYISLVITFNCF